MKKSGIASAALLLAATVSSISHAQSEPRVYTPQVERSARNNDVPEVRVWLEDRSFRYGDVIRPNVAADPDAYLTVFRVSTDGEIKVLYPQYPDRQEAYNGSRFVNDRLPVTGDPAFELREGTGNGFVFAIASYYRFNYSYYASKGRWSIARLASASRFGSPFQMVRSFVEEITDGSSSYSMDYVMYDVNANQYRSRYASRYRGYAYDDYYGMCLDAFGAYYTSYCRGYNSYYDPYIIVSNPVGNGGGQRKSMRIKPLVGDPVLPNVPLEPVPVEGRLPSSSDAREQAAIARHERMLRDQKPRIDPSSVERRADPEPRIYRTQEPMARPQPRMDAPRSEPRQVEPRRIEQPRIERQMPSAPARVEVRNDPPRQAAPPPPPPKQVERPQKDN